MTELVDKPAPAYVIKVEGTASDPHDRSFVVRGPDPIASQAAVRMLWPDRNVQIDHNARLLDVDGLPMGEIRAYEQLPTRAKG
ncbi:hypothetical protein [Bradyrhizobium sp. SZCCHNR3118]|uniref:hypothetical protein n=1 Tax=Bradyrhizobium sp. SZCCHNR3118 TaxID=3057468 RepID=UPI00291634BC|nr:hypothetical protein [Bradyrhizobium sp. SZCCHNR3118]